MLSFYKLIIALGFLALITLAASGPLYRFDLISLKTAFLMFRWAAYAGVAVGIAILISMVVCRPKGALAVTSILALAAAATTAYLPYQQMAKAKSVPAIHDISTDIVSPPAFVAVAPLRADAPNPVEYAGLETAEQQLVAYPDIKTYREQTSKHELFERALKAAQALQWDIVAADRPSGRIEATATTTWFGFKDDVVIRIVDEGNTVKLDIRSKSRVGRSDVGKNAERIREFFAKL